jgi:hypothetical protein
MSPECNFIFDEDTQQNFNKLRELRTRGKLIDKEDTTLPILFQKCLK